MYRGCACADYGEGEENDLSATRVHFGISKKRHRSIITFIGKIDQAILQSPEKHYQYPGTTAKGAAAETTTINAITIIQSTWWIRSWKCTA